MEHPKYTMPLADDDSGAYELHRDGQKVGTILFLPDAQRIMKGLVNVGTVELAVLERLAELRAVVEEAAQVFEAGAAHNREMGRTVMAHAQQDRADRMRAAVSGATEVIHG